VEEAKDPFSRIAAKKAAELAKREVDKKTQRIVDESNNQANKLLDDAKAKADAKANEAKK
jgi:cell division septum initiation protein DivIVA